MANPAAQADKRANLCAGDIGALDSAGKQRILSRAPKVLTLLCVAVTVDRYPDMSRCYLGKNKPSVYPQSVRIWNLGETEDVAQFSHSGNHYPRSRNKPRDERRIHVGRVTF